VSAERWSFGLLLLYQAGVQSRATLSPGVYYLHFADELILFPDTISSLFSYYYSLQLALPTHHHGQFSSDMTKQWASNSSAIIRSLLVDPP
jgi:hypothetical protein